VTSYQQSAVSYQLSGGRAVTVDCSKMFGPGRRLVLRFLPLPLALALLLGCGRPADRPARGAAPGGSGDAPTSAVPPTLAVSDDRLRPPLILSPGPEPVPSPAEAAPNVVPDVSPSPSPSPNPAVAASSAASPAASVLPPIVRTITPADGTSAPAGAPVVVSAVLVGRGTDLADAVLTIDGVAIGAVDQQSPRQWTIRASQLLPPGQHTARVIVNDAGGGRGGFTWRFTVGGGEDAVPKPRPSPAP